MDLSQYLTISEYARECGVNRNTIYLRIKSAKNPLQAMDLSPKDIYEAKKDDEDFQEDRPGLWKAVMDNRRVQRPVRFIDTERFPPARQKPGRKAKLKARTPGPKVQAAIVYAKRHGYDLVVLPSGYKLKPLGTKVKLDAIKTHKRIRDVQVFCRENPLKTISKS